MKPIRVLIVDDSAVVRQVMTAVLERDPGVRVLKAVSDPLFAMEAMKKEWPDVVVLDVEMPRMDGISFLRKIMAARPTPVVICSTLTEKGATTTLQAMEAGAMAIVTKPRIGLKNFLEDASADLLAAVRTAAHVDPRKLVARAPAPMPAVPAKLNADAVLAAPTGLAMAETTDRVVAIGTSTGGTQALEAVLTTLPRTCPGIVVVQHMPENFTGPFAQRLNSLCEVEVREAASNDRVMPGRVLIAPGGRHMLLKRSGAQYRVEVVEGPPVNRHRPSVDVLFRSVARYAGRNALGVIMTGMGDDGAAGLLEMRQAGALTLGQDEASCVVYGMPKEAAKRGAVAREIGLRAIPSEIMAFAGQRI